MRITGGRAGGLILKVPKGLAIRPTPDLVKQAVFNSLGARVVDAEVLELFAGTGALSLECISRGARLAVCVEKSGRHAAVLRENWRRAGFPPESLELRLQDVFAALPPLVMAGRVFDLILADPPYGPKNLQERSRSCAQQLLDDPWLPRLLRPGGRFILGHARRDRLELPPPWREIKVLQHGDSVMRFLEAASEVRETLPGPAEGPAP
ncbi:RsmD family RNA methyltransferase [Limisphaera sp. VF-2]|jgi:16S rRNA (guanine966-N2)-methyltransferase|uniref:RsmD family RNA methyltransferase n=1 Tax=Limisphaera sp. VF-2 TaxID=3400418 RepID=UPI001768AF90|nr:RsmD family RNA methyltransferase [Limisphaera sp.]